MATQWITARRLSTLLDPAPLRRPAYQDLAHRLRMLAVDGRLVDGVRLPSERDLAAQLGVSRSTATAAYTLLRDQGCLRTRPGSGNYLVSAPTDHAPGAGPQEVDGAITMTFSAAAAAPGVAGAYARAVELLPGLLGGHGYLPEGLPALRERLAEWYAARGLPTDPAQVIITGGALAALNLVAETLLDPGDRVLVDSPSYPNALEALRRRGARLIGAPLADQGWDRDALVAATRQSAPRLAYLIPDFHNPTGLLMEADTRQQLGRMLRRERCRPVIDETLVELNLDGATMPVPFAAGQEDAITIGSASKSFWGGLRIGWIRAPHALVRPLVETRGTVDLAAAATEQLVLAELLTDAGEILTEQRSRMRAGRDHLVRLLAEELPEWRVARPGGGQTLWVELGSPRSSELTVAAATHGVIITPGHRFFPSGGGQRHLRLPFTAPPAVLSVAVTRLATAWRGLDGTRVSADGPPYDLTA